MVSSMIQNGWATSPNVASFPQECIPHAKIGIFPSLFWSTHTPLFQLRKIHWVTSTHDCTCLKFLIHLSKGAKASISCCQVVIQPQAIIHKCSLASGGQHHSQTKCISYVRYINTSKLPHFLEVYNPIIVIRWELSSSHKFPLHTNETPQWLQGLYQGSIPPPLLHLIMNPDWFLQHVKVPSPSSQIYLGYLLLPFPPLHVNVPLSSLQLLVPMFPCSNICGTIEPS